LATVRGGYSVAYERQGFGVFTGLYGPLPGSTLTLARNASSGLVPPGESWPVLLSQPERLFAAAPPETATYPIAVRPNRADNVNTFHPDIQIASARSWTIGFQRGLGRNTAVELRYVGTRGELLRRQPGGGQRQRHRQRRVQRLPRAADRAAAAAVPGVLAQRNYQYAVEGGSAFLGLHDGCVMDPQDNVRHAIKMQWH